MKSIFFSSVLGMSLFTLTLQSCKKHDCSPNNPGNNDSTYVDTTFHGNNPSDTTDWNGGNGNNSGDSTDWNGGNPSDSTNWNNNDSLPG